MQTRDNAVTSVQGFSLVELLVSITMVALLTSLVVAGSLAARRASLVQSSADILAGFLRETASFTLNGIKAPGCDLNDPANVALCSRYRVSVAAGSGTYERVAVGGGERTAQTLAGAVRFGSAATVTFQYTPPILTVSPAALVVRHASGSPERRICVSALGRVEVRAGGCP